MRCKTGGFSGLKAGPAIAFLSTDLSLEARRAKWEALAKVEATAGGLQTTGERTPVWRKGQVLVGSIHNLSLVWTLLQCKTGFGPTMEADLPRSFIAKRVISFRPELSL